MKIISLVLKPLLAVVFGMLTIQSMVSVPAGGFLILLLLWGMLFIYTLVSIAFTGRPDSETSTPDELIRFDIGMT